MVKSIINKVFIVVNIFIICILLREIFLSGFKCISSVFIFFVKWIEM